MKWEEFKNITTPEPIFPNLVKTTIECPNCGKKLFYRNNVVLTSYPAQYQYECVCGFIGYSHAKWSDQH